MKLARMLVVCLAVAGSPALMAQKWELGGAFGGGFYTSKDVKAPAGSAVTKIQSNMAGSGWLGNNGQGRWGGELRYDYQRGDLQLKSGGTEATFGAETHAIHYDFLLHAMSSEAKARPFIAFGGGIKDYRGTGKEVVFQPLSNFALLTKANDLTAMVSIGAGIKFQISRNVQFRLDVHDYLTPFPKKVVTPNVGVKIAGWMNDFVPMAGLAITF